MTMPGRPRNDPEVSGFRAFRLTCTKCRRRFTRLVPVICIPFLRDRNHESVFCERCCRPRPRA